MRDPSRPATVAQRMDFHPDPTIRVVQLQRPWSIGKAKMPVSTTGATTQLALAPNDEPPSAALRQRLASGESEVEFEHLPLGW